MTDVLSNPSDLICLAAIAGAFGVSGEVKVKSFTEVPENCVAYGPLYSETGQVILTPVSHRVMTRFIAVSAPEVNSREEAEFLKGTKLFVPRGNLPPPEEDDFYYTDLIGLDVKTTDGKRAGTVKGVHEFGAGDMLEIQPPKSAEKQASWFHPFTKFAVPKVDLKARRVVIHIEDPIIGRNPQQETPESEASDPD